MPATLTKPHQAQLDHQLGKGVEFDLELDPCFLTDKEEVKVIPCRKCKRVCVCNRFAAPGKTECTTCREKSHSTTKVREFDRSKEAHILTDKDKTKEVPCRNCGRPCIVNQFAAPAKVACNDCRGTVAPPKRTVSIEKGDNGRYEEVVHVETPHDREWAEFALFSPMDVPRIYTTDERAEFEEVRDAALAANQAANEARRQRRLLEEELERMPEKPPPDKDAKKRHLAEVKRLEDAISEQDSVEVLQRETHETKAKRQTELARIAWVRGALANRIKIEQRDGRWTIIKRESTVLFPEDYLSEDAYALAMAPYDEEAVHVSN